MGMPVKACRVSGGEVVFGFGEDGDRHRADAEVGGDGSGCAGFGVSDGDAVIGGGDFGDRTIVVDHVAERFCEAIGDAVHSADGLEHGCLPVDLLSVKFTGGHVGGEEFGEVEWLVEYGFGGACATAYDEASSRASGVVAVFAEVPETAEEVEEPGGVLFGEFVVEGVFVDGFAQKLGDVTSGVVDDLALLDGLAVVEVGRLHEG
jgi:hypothetical protein